MKTKFHSSILRIIGVIALFLVVTNLYAQNKLITLHKDNATLQAVLEEVKTQAGCDYMFSDEVISPLTEVTVHVTDVDIHEVLKIIAVHLNIDYKLVDKTIIFSPAKTKSDTHNSGSEKLKQTIRGTIVDKDSKELLIGVNIIIKNSSPLIGTVTDTDGNFKMDNVTVGRHTIVVSFVGYKPLTIPNILVGSSKEIVLNIELTESITELNEVVVKPNISETKNTMSVASGRSFSVEETKRYAASISDPGRMALCFAGVAAGDDLSNEIVIRGNSPEKLLWQIEGVEVPSPNHFAEEGMTAGYISILSSNVVDRSDFFTGAFPAEYGNALSGVFDIALRNGNNEKREYTFQIGVLGTEIAMEGPFKKGYNGSYLINYRYSTLGIIDQVAKIIGDDQWVNTYQDLSFKLNLPTKQAGTFSIWGLGGIMSARGKSLKDSTQWEVIDDRYVDEDQTHMTAIGISNMFMAGKKTYVKTTAAYTRSGNKYNYQMLDYSYNEIPQFNDDKYSQAIKLHLLLNSKINHKLTLRSGIKASYLTFNYYMEGFDEYDIWRPFFNSKGASELYQAYLQGKYSFTDKLQINAGFSSTYYNLSDETTIEPRLGLRWSFTQKQSLALAFGLHSRHEMISVASLLYETSDGIFEKLNKNLQLSKARHVVLSYNINLKQNLYLKTELYHQFLYDIPIAKDTNYTLNSSDIYELDQAALVSKGIGENYGIEFTLEQSFTNDYYFLITSSLFESKFRASNGKWYNSKYNLRYVNNLVAGKELKVRDKNILGVNLKFIWSGGKRDTPLDRDSTLYHEIDIFQQDKRNTTQYKDYLRLDLGISYRINRPKVSQIVSLDIQNVTNRNNIVVQTYSTETGKIEYQYLAGLIPILNYRIEF